MSSRPSTPDDYESLRVYLAGQHERFSLRLTFEEIEAILGRTLPDEAYRSSGWWDNEADSATRQSGAWLEAGFGVDAVVHESDTSGWVGFVRGLQRWPGLGVGSKEFAQKPVDERLRELALGYVQSAKLLCVSLGERPNELSWPRASVACFCYRHAIELFLKSCILHRIPAIDRCSHDISTLRKEFLRLYTHADFYFETPYDISLDDLDELFGVQVALVEDFERKPDQVFRYLSDKKGRPPRGVYFFAPGSWLSLCERLESDINRIWAKISDLDGSAEPGPATSGGRCTDSS